MHVVVMDYWIRADGSSVVTPSAELDHYWRISHGIAGVIRLKAPRGHPDAAMTDVPVMIPHAETIRNRAPAIDRAQWRSGRLIALSPAHTQDAAMRVFWVVRAEPTVRILDVHAPDGIVVRRAIDIASRGIETAMITDAGSTVIVQTSVTTCCVTWSRESGAVITSVPSATRGPSVTPTERLPSASRVR